MSGAKGPARLPVGPKTVVAHGEGRPVLSLRGSKVVTGGSSYGHGPLVLLSIEDGAALRVIRDFTEDSNADARASAVVLEHSGTGAAVIAETGAYYIGVMSPDKRLEIIFQSKHEVSAMALNMDDSTL